MDLVYLCGVTPDPVGDVGTQTRQVLERVDRLLEIAGTDKSRLISAQVWLSDMRLFEDHNAVWTKCRSTYRPTWSPCARLRRGCGSDTSRFRFPADPCQESPCRGRSIALPRSTFGL